MRVFGLGPMEIMLCGILLVPVAVAAFVIAGNQKGRGAAGGTPGPGWFADPTGRHQLRLWDGVGWTASVRDGNVQTEDPM